MDSFSARYCPSCSALQSIVVRKYDRETTRMHLVGEDVNLNTGVRRQIWQCLICRKTA